MSIDTQVGIRHENIPADRTDDDDLCVEGQKGCELITSFVVNKSVSYICTTNPNKHMSGLNLHTLTYYSNTECYKFICTGVSYIL